MTVPQKSAPIFTLPTTSSNATALGIIETFTTLTTSTPNSALAGASTTSAGVISTAPQSTAVTGPSIQMITKVPTTNANIVSTNISALSTAVIPSISSPESTAATASTATTSKILEVVTDLEFRSTDTFIDALSNSSTAEFKNRSKLVKDQLEGVYRPKYANFLRANVIRFRPGSIITSTEIVFSLNQTVPSSKDISDTLVTAVANGTLSLLNIIPQSVSVNGSASTTTIAPTATTASSGLKIESSLLQATCLIIMTKILKLFQ
ncbi:uncharacterized protein [Pseudorasbora parva]|uniref:uncharacterized protein n=1 Tax=Pseudorasbora parva TaxID=51549 RepID=UPI00351E3D2A